MSSISSSGDIPPLGLIMILERGQVFLLPTDYAFKICLPQCAQFFTRAHFCKKTGERRTFFGQKYGR